MTMKSFRSRRKDKLYTPIVLDWFIRQESPNPVGEAGPAARTTSVRPPRQLPTSSSDKRRTPPAIATPPSSNPTHRQLRPIAAVKKRKLHVPLPRCNAAVLPGQYNNDSSTTISDLPAELLVLISEHIQEDDPPSVVAFLNTCKALEASLLEPLLKRMKVIDSQFTSMTWIALENDTPKYLIPLVRRIPRQNAIFLALDLFFLERYRHVVDTWIAQHRIVKGVTLQVNPDDPAVHDSTTVMPSLHNFLLSLPTSVYKVDLRSNSSCSKATVLGPHPSASSQSQAVLNHGRGLFLPNLGSLSISFDWLEFVGFGPIYSDLSRLDTLYRLQFHGIKSQDHCNSTLEALNLRQLRHLRIYIVCAGGIQLSDSFIRRHRGLASISLHCSCPGLKFPNESFAVTIPPIPETSIFSASSSLLIPHPLSLRYLKIGIDSLVPFARSWHGDYCQQLQRYIGQLRSLSNYAFSDLELHIQFPCNLAFHLSLTVSGCPCAEALSTVGDPVLGVAKLTVDVADMDPVTLPLITEHSRRYNDLERLTLEGVRWNDSVDWSHVSHACYFLGRALTKLVAVETPRGDFSFTMPVVA